MFVAPRPPVGTGPCASTAHRYRRAPAGQARRPAGAPPPAYCQRSVLPPMKASTEARATSSGRCSGGDFMK